ncbi:flagellar hook assembly protein FlgD [Halomonas sp. McH1-25]|uniref:flagellar hook assembly protein FlgD n=1 Tax=unclassified Halomonas TaxID=2609666 RepID=UPI001EF5767C|nr:MULTISPECIES: flagellar hook assembly protein FlgD [unclassified Halomonas]MCG7598664.1 flagellar hook assembly protein FlgD [Halomonas sp. McH1-25]MCP1343647.1 flagellar hook assembly protein FlgD [Halomonas sp. FL8]MCP1359398.1 flagellar hook assembly protein FlgD [Halomonas sp. BBD45]
MANSIDSGVLSNMNVGAAGKQTQNTSQELSDSFMTLLITQLKNQDPTKPMENAEMTSQLAQINTVNGIQDLNKTLEGITGQIDAGQALQASALIGQGVLVPGNRIVAGQSDDAAGGLVTTPFGVELASPAEKLTITITNGSGEVVRTYEQGPFEAGVQSFTWPGTLSDGNTDAPAGNYKVSVEATQGDEPVPVTVLNYALVNGVIKGENGPRLDLGGLTDQVDLEDVRQIL